ncbi:MAG: hypothetical protein LWX70_15175, partial [Sphingobacteriia bacterium]|nr:hypothetical protein [Sphingobacteriia bacterium]
MKQIIILTFAVLFCYISEAQQVFQATSFILNQPENGNVEYKASDYIKLVDGFHYKADDNTSFWGHIDPYLVMPPTTGLTGGSNSGDHGVAKLFDGKFGVSPYGSATYNIPIDIPNGINGCQPQISLNYNSSGSVGIMGEGWTIGGISCIEQVPSTYSYDGYAQAIILNEMNPLVLNGRLLKLVDPANFVYRYEEDDQTIIKAINPNDQSQGFIVLSPDGKKSYYGTNSDSRFCLQSNSTIVAWYIEKTEDQHGNSYTFQYEKDLANGGIYPSSVSYTQNTEKSISSFYEIVFHYKPWNVPPKKYLSYIDNTTNYSQINRLLDSISIKYIPQNKVIDGYKLWYSIPTLDFVKTPQLISVTRKNEKDQINPIKFDWHDYNYSNSTDNLTYPIEANFGYKVNITVENFNINNDGLSDVVVKFNEGPFSSGPDNQLMIYENTSNPNNNNYQLTLKHHLILSNYLDDLGHCVYGDFNGDNITEILQIYEGESGNVEGYIGHYDSFGNYIEGDNCLPQGFKVNGTYRIVCSDFSGDGKLDLAFFVKELSFMKILFLVSDADGIFSNLLPSITTETYGYEDHIFSGDFYGDGKTSILFCPGGGNNNGINYNYLIRLNNSSDMAIKTIFAPISNDDLYRNILTGDFNGDNRTDVVRLYEESNNLDILLCNGHGGFIQVGPFTISEITNWNHCCPAKLQKQGCSKNTF